MKHLFFALILISSLKAQAAIPTCIELFQKAEPKEQSFEIAQEIELFRKEFELLDIIEPIGSRLEPLLKDKDVHDYVKLMYPQLSEDERADLRWSNLAVVHRQKILLLISQTVNFEKDRRIPGFRAKSSVVIKPKVDTEFLGQSYKAGYRYIVDLTGFLHETIEYATSFDVKDAGAFEFHFRSKKSALQLRRDIGVFFHAIIPSMVSEESRIQEPLSDHQHIIGKVPEKYFNEMSELGHSEEAIAASLALYHQNLESLTIVLNALNNEPPVIKASPDPNKPRILDYLHSDIVPDIYNYFLALQSGQRPILSKRLKKNRVGVRSHETYSEPDTWGLEFRTVGFDIASVNREYGVLADSAHDILRTQNFPIDPWVLSQIASAKKQSLAELVSNSWWRQTPEEIIKNANSPYMKKGLGIIFKVALGRKMEAKDSLNNGSIEPSWLRLLPFVFYAWDQHPLVYGNTELMNKIKQAQLHFLDGLIDASNDYEQNRFIRDRFDGFVTESGLYDLLQKSVGVKF